MDWHRVLRDATGKIELKISHFQQTVQVMIFENIVYQMSRTDAVIGYVENTDRLILQVIYLIHFFI